MEIEVWREVMNEVHMVEVGVSVVVGVDVVKVEWNVNAKVHD